MRSTVTAEPRLPGSCAGSLARVATDNAARRRPMLGAILKAGILDRRCHREWSPANPFEADVEHWMEFDAVHGTPGLTVLAIKETHAGDDNWNPARVVPSARNIRKLLFKLHSDASDLDLRSALRRGIAVSAWNAFWFDDLGDNTVRRRSRATPSRRVLERIVRDNEVVVHVPGSSGFKLEFHHMPIHFALVAPTSCAFA